MHKLDNVIWQALTTTQASFAEGFELARRFPPEVSVLGAIRKPSPEAYAGLARLVQQQPVGLFLEEERLPAGWAAERIVPLLQMVWDQSPLPALSPEQSGFIDLHPADSPQMMALAELTKPGPFGRRTHELGNYIGIRQAGKLVAMAGERLRLPGYAEISAVCTHPDYAGRGYAKLLMSELMRRIVRRIECPFLHVRNENVRAAALYRRLGFRERAQLYYAVVRWEEHLGAASTNA